MDDIIYIDGEGAFMFSEKDYVLDVIKTNLLVLKDSFIDMDTKTVEFGTDFLDTNEPYTIQTAVSDIIQRRLSNIMISLESVSIQNNIIEVRLNYTGTSYIVSI